MRVKPGLDFGFSFRNIFANVNPNAFAIEVVKTVPSGVFSAMYNQIKAVRVDQIH